MRLSVGTLASPYPGGTSRNTCSSYRPSAACRPRPVQRVSCTATKLSERLAYSRRDVRRIGSLEVSPMGLGTWAWGNRFLWNYDPSQDQELQAVWNTAVAAGINLFDTADSYGTGDLNGRSEMLLGQFLREYPGSDRAVQRVHIATKLAAYPWRVTPWNMTAACKGSARRLGLECISLGQLHWSAAKYAPLQEWAMVNGLADCYLEGLVSEVGVSNYGPRQLEVITKQLAKRDVPLASAQVQLSLLSFGPEQQQLLEVAKESGVTVIAYSPLALGLLSGKYNSQVLPKGPRAALFKKLLQDSEPLLSTLKEVARYRKKSMSQVAVNWCIAKGTIPIPGARDMAQVVDVLGALGWALSRAEVDELDDASRACKGGMVQNIFQTK